MKFKIITGIMLTLLLTTMLILVFNIRSVKAYPTVTSGWLTFPVTFDGKITTVEEWSDTTPVDITLPQHAGPGNVSARIWMKNDHTWLSMLYRVEWSAGDTDPLDVGYINYYWDWLGCPPYPCWNHSDSSGVQFDNTTWDGYGWDETTFYYDVLALPPGENNTEGAATHDGTYYWFEFRKELDSGDGYDWAFVPGQVIETINQVQSLLIGVWDDSTGDYYEENISLHLSPPAGGDINGDRMVDIYDIVICALAFGSKPGHPRWNPIADIRQDGIIDIFDLITIAIHYGEHV